MPPRRRDVQYAVSCPFHPSLRRPHASMCRISRPSAGIDGSGVSTDLSRLTQPQSTAWLLLTAGLPRACSISTIASLRLVLLQLNKTPPAPARPSFARRDAPAVIGGSQGQAPPCGARAGRAPAGGSRLLRGLHRGWRAAPRPAGGCPRPPARRGWLPPPRRRLRPARS